MRKKRTFTKKEKQFIKENYLEIALYKLGRKFCTSIYTIKEFLKNENLVIPKEILEKRKRNRKGCPPPNKGKKMEDYLSPERLKIVKEKLKTNVLEEGSIVIKKNGHPGKKSYRYIKTKGKLVRLANYRWEKENGEIPKNFVVRFKDGNTLNDDLDNIEVVDKIQVSLENFKRYDKEMIPLMILIKKLKNKINEIENNFKTK